MVQRRQAFSDYRQYWFGPDYSYQYSYIYKPITNRFYYYSDYWPYDWESWRYWPSWRSYYKFYMDNSVPTYKLRSYWPSWRFWHFLDELGVYKHKSCQDHVSAYIAPSISYRYKL